MGEHPYTRKWQRLSTYGGKLFENICQGGSRDVLYAAQQPVEDAGFKIVLHVHDELVTEASLVNKELTLDKLCSILSSNPSWGKGLPLAAAGFESDRYKK
jgi:DNA polymerase